MTPSRQRCLDSREGGQQWGLTGVLECPLSLGSHSETSRVPWTAGDDKLFHLLKNRDTNSPAQKWKTPQCGQVAMHFSDLCGILRAGPAVPPRLIPGVPLTPGPTTFLIGTARQSWGAVSKGHWAPRRQPLRRLSRAVLVCLCRLQQTNLRNIFKHCFWPFLIISYTHT